MYRNNIVIGSTNVVEYGNKIIKGDNNSIKNANLNVYIGKKSDGIQYQ